MTHIGFGTTRVGGGGDSTVNGNVIVNLPDVGNPIEYKETIRLSGDSATEFALPFRDQVNDYGGSLLIAQDVGTEGRKYRVTGNYKSIAVEFLRETEQDAQVNINNIGYRHGVGNNTDTVLPYHEAAADAFLTQSYDIECLPGCFVEISIARQAISPVAP